jgi:hypothetical protein
MKLILAIVFALTPALSYADSLFPFTTHRAADGKIETIELSDLKLDPDDSKDPAEIREQKEKLSKEGYFHLLAAPNDPEAFQRMKSIVTIGGDAVDVAKAAVSLVPILGAASSLLSQHIRNLEARRVFFQNALLVYLDHTSEFTKKEKSLIRSSIFFSRISIQKDRARDAAMASWSTYGDDSLHALYAKCEAKNQNPDPKYGVCFKLVGSKIKNLAVKKGLFRTSPATAYNLDRPNYVKDKRYAFMAVKTGSSFIPIPGAGFVVRTMLNSMIENQRRSEGMLYAQLVIDGDLDLANEIRETSANPTM